MVGHRSWKRYATAVGLFSMLAAGGQWGAVALAQGNPDAGSSSASSDAGASTEGSADAGGAAPVYSGPAPWFFMRPPRVGPGISVETVHRLVTRAANQTAIVQCYTQVLATNPRAHALVNARLEVIAGGIGTIDSLHVSPANQTMEDCIRAAVGNVEWPNPRGVPSTSIEFQIDLAPTAPPPARH